MPIHDLSYRHWEGKLKPRTFFRWWVITKAELLQLAQRKFVRFIVAIPPTIYILVHGTLIYISDRIPQMRTPWQIDPRFFKDFLLRTEPIPSGLFIGLLGVFGGASLIADDIKHNALQLYLAKPITWLDYLLGKLGVMVVLLASITLIPALLLFIEHIFLVEDLTFFQQNYWVIFSIILYSLVIIIPSSLLIVTLSSLTSNGRYAAIGLGVILLGTPLVYRIIREITRSSKTAVISIWANFDILGAKLFGLQPAYALHWAWSLLALLGLAGLCFWVLRRRIKAVHIVK
jgi:ABC-type transport system involved in multi-copper enzyme maturation permease subunit